MFHDFNRNIIVGKCFRVKVAILITLVVELSITIGSIVIGVYDVFATNGIPAAGILLILVNIANGQMLFGLIRGLVSGNTEDFPAYAVWKVITAVLCVLSVFIMWKLALPYVKREEDAIFGTIEHILIGATVFCLLYGAAGLYFGYCMRDIHRFTELANYERYHSEAGVNPNFEAQNEKPSSGLNGKSPAPLNDSGISVSSPS